MSSKLMGYLDDLSYAPGETVVGRLSGTGKGTARIARLAKVSEFKTESRILADCSKIELDLALQTLDAGSGFVFQLTREISSSSFNLKLPTFLTLIDEKPRVVLSLERSGSIAEICVDSNGLFWQGAGARHEGARIPILKEEWFDLEVKVDTDAGTFSASVGSTETIRYAGALGKNEPWTVMLGRRTKSFGSGCYAKFEGPSVYQSGNANQPVVQFDFSSDFASQTMTASGVTGSFINHPTRRVLGRRPPDILCGFTDSDASYYSAIHVHALNLTNANWDATCSITLPQDCSSGIYALDVHSDSGERTRLPFVVKPGRTAAKVLFILPTNTYLAYGNERLAFSDRGEAIAADTDGVHLNDLDKALGEEPLLGASIYDRHADGSGVHYSSRRRPLLNLTPDYLGWWCTQVPRHFLADLNIPRWLGHIDQDYDVVTDEDVHKYGHALLKQYQVIITGTHPEYPSPENLKAMHEYSATGNLIYMGGNGFYWVTGHDPADFGVVEARRGFAGQRNWTSNVLEVRLSTNNETGGLWRHRGIAPNTLTGIGSVAVGFTKGSGYERTEASYSSSFAAFFEGVGHVIGEDGEILGGAASDELDASNSALGTPKTAVVLARSRHNRTYLPFIEEEMEVQHNLGGDFNPTVRSEIVYFQRPTGGKVFSAGAINFCGALGSNGFDNSAARLATNVLRDFLSRDG